MSLKWDILGKEGLRFFGEISASISHEIKNALSIISENAGLLQDLTLMQQKGKPVEPGRLNDMAERVIQQVRRADSIVANLNTFAHSIDQDIKAVDLGETVRFVAMISERLASMSGATLEPKTPERPIMITTSPFFLENLLWLCIKSSLEFIGQSGKIGLIAEKTENGGCIRITGFSEIPAGFSGERENALLEALSARQSAERDSGELVLTFPSDIRAGR